MDAEHEDTSNQSEHEDAEFLRNLEFAKDIAASWPAWQQKTPSTCIIHKLPSREQIAAIQEEESGVYISRERYEELLAAEFWLQCLEEAGVDNWCGMELAGEIFREYKNKQGN